MSARRFFTAAGVVAVAGVAGAISYRHQEHLAATHGQGSLAAIWPLCVDGLIVVTSIAISTDRAAGFRARLWAVAGFWIGVLVSVTTNWLATSGGIVNHAISAFPALAFLLAIESLSSKPREPKTPTVSVEPTPFAQVGKVTGAGKKDVSTLNPTPAKPRRTQSAAAKVAAVAKRMPDATPTQIAAKAGVTERTARRHIDAAKGVHDGGHPVGNVPSEPARNSAPVPISPTGPDGPVARVNGTHVLAEVNA